MKSILLLILGIFVSNFAMSQARIGFSEKEIRDEFDFLEWYESSSGYFNNRSIKTKYDNSILQYIFDHYDNRCIMTVIFPLTESELNKRITRYNSECKKIYENHWIDKSEIHIELIDDDRGKYFIYWQKNTKDVLIKS